MTDRLLRCDTVRPPREHVQMISDQFCTVKHRQQGAWQMLYSGPSME